MILMVLKCIQAYFSCNGEALAKSIKHSEQVIIYIFVSTYSSSSCQKKIKKLYNIHIKSDHTKPTVIVKIDIFCLGSD